MKTHFTFSSAAVYSFVVFILLNVHTGCFAQAPDHTVIAVSKDGVTHQAPSSLQAVVFPLDIYPLKFRVALENTAGKYVTITVKDRNGNILTRKTGIRTKTYVATFNMSRLSGGIYTVEVENKLEKHRYHVQLTSRVVRDVQITPYKPEQRILAKARK